MTSDVERARTLGAFAAGHGRPLTGCPFNAAGTPRERMLAAAWVRGFFHRRPDAAQPISHQPPA